MPPFSLQVVYVWEINYTASVSQDSPRVTMLDVSCPNSASRVGEGGLSYGSVVVQHLQVDRILE